MKKIGIITYHFARNYGAVLQCFALQTFLEKKGYSVEIINYINKEQYNNNDYYKHGKNLKKIVINIMLLPFLKLRKKKNNSFDRFNETYLHLTEKISTIDDLEKLVSKKKYDYLISGSDQVFNPNIEDFDYSFLLPFKTNSQKIAYAASTGNASQIDINKLKNYLLDFSKISIREKSDLYKFDNIKKKIYIMPDPVLLLKKEDWYKKFDKQNEDKYLLCYFLHKNLFKKEYYFAKKIAKAKKLKILNLNARYSVSSLKKGTIFDAGPEEFITLIKNSNFVCTDSFHGTLFSIIFEKDFVCFDSKSNIKDSRRKNVLEMFDKKKNLCYIENKKYSYEKTVTNPEKIIDSQIKIAEEFFGDLNA